MFSLRLFCAFIRDIQTYFTGLHNRISKKRRRVLFECVHLQVFYFLIIHQCALVMVNRVHFSLWSAVQPATRAVRQHDGNLQLSRENQLRPRAFDSSKALVSHRLRAKELIFLGALLGITFVKVFRRHVFGNVSVRDVSVDNMIGES